MAQPDDALMVINPCKGWRICLYLLSWLFAVIPHVFVLLIVPACLSMSSRLAVQCPDPKGVKVVFGRKCSFASCKPRMIDAQIAII